MRTRVYVDGFNLYYGSLKDTPFKWLNLVDLAHKVLPSSLDIDKLIYFTARSTGILNPKTPRNQQVYLNALGTLPEIEIHFGSFLAKTIWRPVMNLPVADRQIDTPEPVTLPAGNHPVAGSQIQTLPVGSYSSLAAGRKKHRKAVKPFADAVIAEVHTLEEKGSDVNLAAHLLNDAWKGLFDVAAVISNDTDLEMPIRMVTFERKKPVYVICPGRWHIAPKLKRVASHVRHIHRSHLKAAQFPNPIPNSKISKPAEW